MHPADTAQLSKQTKTNKRHPCELSNVSFPHPSSQHSGFGTLSWSWTWTWSWGLGSWVLAPMIVLSWPTDSAPLCHLKLVLWLCVPSAHSQTNSLLSWPRPLSLAFHFSKAGLHFAGLLLWPQAQKSGHRWSGPVPEVWVWV